MGTPRTSQTETKTLEPVRCGGDAEAIRAISDLTMKGVMPEITTVPLKGLGAGLPEAIPVVRSPGEDSVQFDDLKAAIEAYRFAPALRTGRAVVTTLKSFIELVKRHKDDHSAIFAKTDWPSPSLTAVIDYHQTDGAARNTRHRVHYPFPVTPEFQAWIAQNGKPMGQAEFALFLEEHAAELTAPDDGERSHFERLFKVKFAAPNDLIDLARSLEIRVGQTFKQAVKLQSGEAELVFAEEHTGRNGEAVTVPGVFMIALKAFVDGDEVRVPARLRYRAAQGSVTWFYNLYRWEDELRERVSQDLDKAGKDTGLPTFEGAPEA